MVGYRAAAGHSEPLYAVCDGHRRLLGIHNCQNLSSMTSASVRAWCQGSNNIPLGPQATYVLHHRLLTHPCCVLLAERVLLAVPVDPDLAKIEMIHGCLEPHLLDMGLRAPDSIRQISTDCCDSWVY